MSLDLGRKISLFVRLSAKLLLALFTGIYLLVVRSFLAVLTVYVAVYFLSSTTVLKNLLTQAVSSEIPGFITASTIQWGPQPWTLNIADISIHGEHAQQLLVLDALETEIDLVGMATGLAKLVLLPDAPIPVHFRSARLLRPWMHLDVDEEGLIGLVRAFYIPNDEPSGDIPSKDLRISFASIENLHGRIDLPEVSVDVQGLDLITNFNLTNIDDIRFLVPRANVAEIQFHLRPHFKPTDSLERWSTTLKNIKIHRFQFVLNHFDLMRLSADLDGGAIRARWAMDFVRAPEPIWTGATTVELSSESTLVPSLLGGLISGPISVEASGHGSLIDANMQIHARSPHLVVPGFSISDLDLKVGIEPKIAPDGRMSHHFRFHDGQAHVFGGQLSIPSLVYSPRWALENTDSEDPDAEPAHPTLHFFDGVLELEGVAPWSMIAAALYADQAPELPFLGGNLEGTLSVRGALEEYKNLLHIDGHTDSLVMRWMGLPNLPLAKAYRAKGAFEFSSGPPGAVFTAPGRFEPHENVLLHDVVLESANDSAHVAGSIDLARETFDARADIHLDHLGKFISRFGAEGMGGKCDIANAHIQGSFTDPSIEANVHITDGRIANEPIGSVDASLRLNQGLLSIAELSTASAWGGVKAKGEIRLYEERIDRLHPRMPFRVEALKFRDVDLYRLRPGTGIAGTLSIEAPLLTGDARDVLKTLSGVGKLVGKEIRIGPEIFDEVTTQLLANRTALRADNIQIMLESGDVISGYIAFMKQKRTFNARINAENFPFAAFQTLEANDIPLSGSISTNITLDGKLSRPHIIGTVDVEDFVIEPLHLGDGSISLTTSRDGKVELTAIEQFPGLELLDGSFVELENLIPRHVFFKAAAVDAEVFKILPLLSLPETNVQASGLVEVDLWTDRVEDSWQVMLDAKPGDVEIRLYGGEIMYQNLSELFLVQKPSGLTLAPLTLGRGLDDSLTVCGWLDDSMMMDLQLTGRANLEIAKPLKTLFSLLEGGLVIGTDSDVVDSLGPKQCLFPEEDRLLRLTGSVDNPSFAGYIETSNVQMIPRNFGREIRFLNGSGARLRPGTNPGEQEIVILKSPSKRVRGVVEDGKFSVWGTMGLKDFLLDGANLNAVGTDIFYSSSGEYNLTFNPDISIRVEHFGDDARRILALGGRGTITEGSYYRSFDQLSQALGSVGGKGGTRHELPLTERVPWLKSLIFDLDVSAGAFDVTSPYTGGAAELETRFDLKVQGTLDEPLIYNRLELIPGGQVSYDVIGRKFEIVHGYLDFRGDASAPVLDVELETEVSYDVQIGSDEDNIEERLVTISIRITGVPPEYNLELWSVDDASLDQADLQSLILTGRPRDETATLEDTLGISFDFGNVLRDILQSPLFEAFKARVGPQGMLATETLIKLGRAMQVHTKVTQDTDETRVRAGFQFQLADRFSLEGTVLRTDRAQNPTQTYEARFKYRIPLD